jgi:branched-chain amino acid transport system substrate-binding protein
VVVIDEPADPFKQQNRLIMQGATVALEALDAAGGVGHHGVRLLPESLDGLSPAAVQRQLRAAGPGAVLVLPCDTNAQFSLASGAAPYKTLMFAPCDADAALAQTIPTYWPVGMAGNDEAAGLAAFMQREGYRGVYVLDTPGLTYATTMTRYFREAARDEQLVVTGSGTASMTGLTSAVIKRLAAGIKAAPRTTAVFSALPPPYIDQLAAGLAGDGVDQIVFGTSAMDTPLTLSAHGSAALEDATLPSYGFLRQDEPAAEDFVNQYRARFGLPVGSFPGLGFETIRLIAAAVAKAGSSNPATIEQALLGGISLSGVALFDRSYTAGSDHNPVGTVSVEKISSGSFLPLLTSAPPTAPAP